MKSLILTFVTWAVISGISHALPVTFLAWDDGISERKLGVVSGKDSLPIHDLQSLYRTRVMNVTPGEAGLILRATDRTSPDGKPVDFKVDRATSFSKVLVILMPDPKSPAGVRGIAIDDSNSNFNWGDFRWINATGKPLGLVAGTEKKVLPTDWTPVDIKGKSTPTVPIALYSPAAPQRPSYSALWNQDPNIRRLVIVLQGQDARLGSTAVKVIVEDKAAAAISSKPER